MNNRWVPNNDVSDHVTLERMTMESLSVQGGDPTKGIQLIGELLQNESVSREEAAQLRCQLAELLELTGRYDEALAAITPVDLTGRQYVLPQTTIANLWYRLGSIYRWLDNAPRSIYCATNALKLYTEIKDVTGCGSSHALIGYVYWMIDEYAISRDHLLAGLDHLEAVGDARALAQTYWNLSLVDYLEGRQQESREDSMRGLELLEKMSSRPTVADHISIGKLLNNLAMVEIEEGNIHKAVANYERAIEHWSQTKDRNLLGIAYNNLADAQLGIGEWQRAETSLKMAFDLATGINKRTESVVLDTLGELYLRQGRFQDAERCVRRAIELALETGIKSIEAMGWETLGDVFLAQNRVDDALVQFQHTLQLNSKIGRLVDIPGTYLRLATGYLQRSDIDKAADYLKQAQELLKTQPNLHMSGLAARYEGIIRLSRGESTEAISLLAQSISIFESISFAYEAACSHLEIGLAMARTANPQRALSHLEKACKTFTDLKAEPRQKQATEAIERLLDNSYSMRPESAALTMDTLIVERLITAATSHDLLLREVATIIRDELQMQAVVFEQLADESLKLVTARGCDRKEADRAFFELRLHLEEEKPLPPGVQLKLLADNRHTNDPTPLRRFWLYLSGGTPASATKLGNLDSLLRVVELGLENCMLRNTVRASQTIVSSYKTSSNLVAAGFVCESPAMMRALERIQKIRSSDVTVLITGESGVGKELIARAVHNTSARSARPFLPFNCAAIPAELVESRLFGHRRGAFTGADKDSFGIIRAASGGTLFLDEIGELTLHVQPKLLRFLQDREIHPVGEDHPVKVDVRVVAATNRDLEKEVERGKFREDLYHRLNVIRIHVPPLRERREDIPVLVRYLLKAAAKKENKTISLSEAAMEILSKFSWPGNVRQLKNEIERAVALAPHETILMPEHFSNEVWQRPVSVSIQGRRSGSMIATPKTLSEAVEELERKLVSEALERHSGNITRAARELGLTRQGLILKRKRFGLETIE
ncbi:MAG TPA: sigma 54-interacting transcriptional regulator [Acidobacteriota bacterium]|nr:sigma 54-interacting transcriptional regulator [Acidobacteriota bacterium]HNB71049.1 sigma 54-interacting transcriptional regulator [Acidobacteriota bacterium]HNG91529.1 sigma 54-interacting transcriptional regulator [Acidobacteriota bacterium]